MPAKLTITALDAFGNGKATINDKPIFVPGALPGEVILPLLVEEHNTYEIIKQYKSLSTHPQRTQPACPVFSACGGCQLQHLTLAGQLKYKMDHLQTLLDTNPTTRYIHCNFITATTEWHFRHKIIYHIKTRETLGYFSANSHKVVPHKICLTDHPKMEQLKPIYEQWLQSSQTPLHSEGCGIRAIQSRYNQKAEFLVTISSSSPPKNEELLLKYLANTEGFLGLVWHINTKQGNAIFNPSGQDILVAGQEFLVEEIASLKFRIGAQDFFQTNPEGARQLVLLVRQFADLNGNEYIVDLFAGVGLLGLSLANKASQVDSIEANPSAARQAMKNAKLNSIRNFKAHASDSAHFFNSFGTGVDVLVIDPPRRGLSEQLLSDIIRIKPRKIIYVSCNPISWQRDAVILIQTGYRCDRLQPLDMFPHTLHYELVSRFSLT